MNLFFLDQVLPNLLLDFVSHLQLLRFDCDCLEQKAQFLLRIVKLQKVKFCGKGSFKLAHEIIQHFVQTLLLVQSVFPTLHLVTLQDNRIVKGSLFLEVCDKRT